MKKETAILANGKGSITTKVSSGQVEVQARLEIPALNIRTIVCKIIGDTGLIVNNFNEKTQQQILDKHVTGIKAVRELKNVRDLFKKSMYHLPGGGTGFPCRGVKAAMVSASHTHVDLAKTVARGALYIPGEMIKITGKPRMRKDPVRVGMGKPDIRVRAEYPVWSAMVPIRYNADILSPQAVVNLLNIAGFASGLGEWRPQKGGNYGMFHVEVGRGQERLK